MTARKKTCSRTVVFDWYLGRRIETAIGTVSATISKAAVAELGLAAGSEAVAVIKATSVMVGIE